MIAASNDFITMKVQPEKRECIWHSAWVMSANILKFSSAKFNALLVKWQLNESMFLSEWKKVGKNVYNGIKVPVISRDVRNFFYDVIKLKSVIK
jgi:hypothetical protein